MIELHPQIISKEGKNEFVVLPYQEFKKLQETLEDIEDLRDLRLAKQQEGFASTTTLEEVKRKFGL
ncbi:MAG: type II toxin-antitoxin system prevent-host-death family antitoxin [Ignavibacteria bacterium]|nr:type II toxin-antitoxin system prevent-host-death family antitoxin [Ignavibacteria bacterium]